MSTDTVVDTVAAADLTGVLPDMDVAGRADRVRALFDEADVDALLVTDLSNVRYLTGFTGSAARLLVTDDGMLLVTDGRYAAQAPDQIAAHGVTAAVAVGTTLKEQDEVLAAAAGTG
ncbi:MAG TPA: aminopeptidase P family N-terminal domain-containing protein, partial [Iamia sp.]|nr:aminopeptidase P family N-terminal domain-containing protein [Iamia sp.]